MTLVIDLATLGVKNHNEMVKEITTERVVAALSDVLDPEIGIDIVELGLVYGILVKERDIHISMTMTTPACPLNSYFESAVQRAIRKQIPEAMALETEMVWEPQWNPAMMSPAAKQQMGWRG